MAKSIKESITKFFNEQENTEGIEFGKIANIWEKTVGRSINQNTEIISFKFGKIIIKTNNPVWRNELSFQKTEILAKIRAALPEIKIKEIKIK